MAEEEVVNQIIGRIEYLNKAVKELEEFVGLESDDEIREQCSAEMVKLVNQKDDLIDMLQATTSEDLDRPISELGFQGENPRKQEPVPEILKRIEHLEKLTRELQEKIKQETNVEIRKLYSDEMVQVLNEEVNCRKIVNDIVSGPAPFQLLHLIRERDDKGKAIIEIDAPKQEPHSYSPDVDTDKAKEDSKLGSDEDSKKFELKTETSSVDPNDDDFSDWMLVQRPGLGFSGSSDEDDYNELNVRIGLSIIGK